MYQITFRTESRDGARRLKTGVKTHVGINPAFASEQAVSYLTEVPVERILNAVRLACLKVRGISGNDYYCADDYCTDEYDI